MLVTDAFRSVAEQDALYAQGRTKAGNIVTNARGKDYQSQHQWGIAFDFCQNKKGSEYNSTYMKTVAKRAKALGLGWGGDWSDFPDTPHLYLPTWGTTPTKLKAKYGTPTKFKKVWPVKPVLKPGFYKITALVPLRCTPDVKTNKIRTLLPGKKIQVVTIKDAGNRIWGHTIKGNWVCLWSSVKQYAKKV